MVAAIVHDSGLGARPELVQAGLSMAAVVLENQRLTAAAEASLRALELSRARLAVGAERERRKIERICTTAPSSGFIALGVELELAQDLVATDPRWAPRGWGSSTTRSTQALEELRALAHGVYPPLLADRGLPDALRSVAERLLDPGRRGHP